MFMKLLLTLLVIGGALVTLRLRAQRRLNPPAQQARLVNPPLPDHGRRRLWVVFSGALMLLALTGAGFYIYHQWMDSYQEVTIRVIDSQTGKEIHFKAYKGDIDGRSFVTLDGRRVTLAESERMETAR
jgi:hypothetical protein